MAAFSGSSTRQLLIVRTTVRAAGQLAMRCKTSLSLSLTPSGYDRYQGREFTASNGIWKSSSYSAKPSPLTIRFG